MTLHVLNALLNRRSGRPVWKEKFDFRKGWCNFSHFASTTTKLPENRKEFLDLIFSLLRKNAALQLAPKQRDWDLLLPVYTGDVEKPIDRDHLSAIFVQIKNRQKPEAVEVGDILEKILHPAELCLCIQMELGSVHKNPSSHMIWPTFRKPKKDDTKDTEGDTQRAFEPFIFSMQTFGAGRDTFPFLAKYPRLQQKCRELLDVIIRNEYPDEQKMSEDLKGFPVNQGIATLWERAARKGVTTASGGSLAADTDAADDDKAVDEMADRDEADVSMGGMT